MKKIVLISFFLLALSGGLLAGEGDVFDSIPVDKVAHFGIGVLSSHVMQQGWGWKPAQACAGVLVIATVKEYYDQQTGGEFDGWDWTATALGWAAYNSINIRFEW